MSSWTATAAANGRVNFKGPAGDTLTFNIDSDILGMAWDTFTLTGAVKVESTGQQIATLAIADRGTTANQLRKKVTLTTTESKKLPEGVTCLWAVQASKPTPGDASNPFVKEWWGGKITASMDVVEPNA